MPDPIKRINAWSSPRNISTALMYSFAQRRDTTVVDEPLYAHYLSKNHTAVVHPGAAEILESQHQNGDRVVEEVIMGAYETPVVLFKQMTHHLIELEESFLNYTDHIMLIRPPRAIIHSYMKVIDKPAMIDVGVEQQYHLFRKLQSLSKLAAIVDCEELLKAPEKVLEQLCHRLELEYDERMLRWPAGKRPEDGVWARYWYDNVHRSTGFIPYKKREYQLSGHAAELAEKCQPYYDTLFEQAIKA
jgi:hypothetical protein